MPPRSLTLLIVTVWARGEGIELLRRRLPGFCERVAKNPAGIALAQRLDRMALMLN